MSFSINRIFGNLTPYHSLDDEIPYRARSIYDLTYGDNESNETRGYLGLNKLLGKQVTITYFQGAISPNILDLTGVLKDFRLEYVHVSFSTNHTFNLITLRMQDGRELKFIDGEPNDLNSIEGKETSGIIRTVKITNP